MTTLTKATESKSTEKTADTYATAAEASLAKNAELITRFKSLNVKVVVKK